MAYLLYEHDEANNEGKLRLRMHLEGDPVALGHIKVRNDGPYDRYIHKDLTGSPFEVNYPR